MKGIKLIRLNQEELQISFKSKIELKNNSYYQDVLKNYHSTYKQEGAILKCLCNDVDMSCKKTSYFFLSNLPRNSDKHSEDCIYYEHLENLTDNEDKYRPLIFKEPELIDFSQANQKEKSEYKQKETHRKNTYNNFCIDMISEAVSISFNVKNKLALNRVELVYPSCKDFLNSFNILINDNDLLQNGSIRKSLDNYYNFCYGLVNYDFISLLENKEKEYNIILPTIINKFDDNKKFIGHGIKNIDFKINYHKLKATSDLVKNFNNYISAPYFFMAIYKQNKDNKKLIRLFLHPVYFDKQFIVFVDSGYERKYAQNLIENQIPFIKPITSSCFNRINGKFVNYKINNIQKRAYLHYLPDFIEFNKNIINIVEVSGYDSIEYQNLLDKKRKHYENESEKSKGLYQAKVISGEKL